MYEYRRKGKHLTSDERVKIERLHKEGMTQTQIAKEIGVSQQAISDELRKGQTTQLDGKTWMYKRVYTADAGQRYADYQKTAHSNGLKIGKNYAYLQALALHLQNRHSPYSAIHAVKQTGNFEIHISKTTLYRYIKEGLVPDVTYKTLPVGHPKKRKGKVTALRVTNVKHRSIERRSQDVTKREQFGHWEMDSVIGKSKGKHESLLVLTERKTRLEVILRTKEKTADATVKCLCRLRRYFGKDYTQLFKTITCDNGSEFANQKEMDATGTTLFYCHPQAPQERGSNENANKLIRRHFPKGQSLQKVTPQQVSTVQHFVNHYHREMFKGQTAAQKFAEELPNLKLNNEDKIKQFFAI